MINVSSWVRVSSVITSLLASILLLALSVSSAPQSQECWASFTQASCNANATLGCKWNTQYSYCDRWDCFSGDGTNQTFCETTLKSSYNQSCTWTASGSLCDPTGGNFFGSGCPDYDNNEQGCLNTFFCSWNASSGLCDALIGSFNSQVGAGNNPQCGIINNLIDCPNIRGCTWDATLPDCTGNLGGMSCGDINKTNCGGFTLLSSCCGWNGTNCTTSFDKGCYDNIPTLPVGSMFCEDYNVYKSKTQCENISNSPYYMPCKWDNGTEECHFNSGAYGGFADFGEIGTESGCSGISGTWKSEQYIDTSGSLKTDTWCEPQFGFDFGGSGGNCDTACWACEAKVSTAKGNTTAQAKKFCQNSSLGYCEFYADANAFNGLGWCNPKNDFVFGGAKDCNDDCASCEFLNDPETRCWASGKGNACLWVNDSNAANGVGFCYGKNEKYCGNDCWSCFTFSDCNGGNGGSGACQWDSTLNICKPTGYTGEICFDGADNDNDGKLDCADADCAANKFCGGDSLADKFGNCPKYTSNTTCVSSGCAWVKDNFQQSFGGANAGRCDFPGVQCARNGKAQADCQNVTGCRWTASLGDICMENNSMFNDCFPQSTQGACLGRSGCGWSSDPFSGQGRCEPLMFSQCFGNDTRRTSQEACEANYTVSVGPGKTNLTTQLCTWSLFIPTGSCEPICYQRPGNNCLGFTRGLCETRTGVCEPTVFGGSCSSFDGNQTWCNTVLNATCEYFVDYTALNGKNSTEPAGWCDDKGKAKFAAIMGDKPPVILGQDPDDPIIDAYDINGLGLRDDFDRIVFGTTLYNNFNTSGTCNATAIKNGKLGGGILNYTFFWYVDADGNSTNRCTTRDNSSLGGFEFSFKYQSKWGPTLSEIRLAYQCINGTWGIIPVPMFSDAQKMCSLIGGGMAGIDKTGLFKFKGLYNKSKDLRIYSSVSNIINNDSSVNDTIGPLFYSQGSFDFRFEDCGNSGGDADGDGLAASNDPDCAMFLKFGFVPNEAGFQCGDNIDNDGDSKTDCADEACKMDFVCGGNGIPAVDTNDKTAPKLTWLQADTFPDSAFLMYDTNEPANGTVDFYNNDSTCSILNKTVRDVGLTDSFVPDYKTWHDGSLDAYGSGVDQIPGAGLRNGTVFYYKTRVCDINSNCAVSACLNFTTKGTTSSCKSCTSTFNFPFTPPSGVGVTTPMGNMTFKFNFPDGTSSEVGANAGAGKQLNYTSAKNFNLRIENPNALNSSKWRMTLINASVSGKVATGSQNFTGGSDFQFNSTANGSFVGMSTTKCQELINSFRPKKVEIGMPGNLSTTELWHCTSALGNCTNMASNATLVGYNSTLNMTLWLVPASLGC